MLCQSPQGFGCSDACLYKYIKGPGDIQTCYFDKMPIVFTNVFRAIPFNVVRGQSGKTFCAGGRGSAKKRAVTGGGPHFCAMGGRRRPPSVRARGSSQAPKPGEVLTRKFVSHVRPQAREKPG